jgi:ATP-dependent helicase/DNAse subunit B
MAERALEPRVRELSNQGKTIYSISKLNTYDKCEFSYYLSYVKGQRGKDNVYSILGGKLHDALENLYNNKEVDLKKILDDSLIELDMLNIKFPNEKIKENWEKDILHFCNNFKAPNGTYVTEDGILFEVFDGVYLQGYIDLQQLENENTISIYDFKTSSKFAKEDLVDYGRQLVLYAMAKEKEGKTIDKLAWNMLKYIYVSWKLKNGKINKKMCNRGKWVNEIKNKLEKELEMMKVDEFVADIMIEEAVTKNDISMLPQKVQDMITVEDCILEYDYNEEVKEELIKYVKRIHNAIQSKDRDNEDDWAGIKITDKNSFFCVQLCGQKKCKYLKEYFDDKEFGNKSDKDKEMEELFG